MRVSVVIPALDEEEAIGAVVRAVPPSVAEVIVVDNGSSDRTAARAREEGARVVEEPRRGYGRARRAGVAAASPNSEAIVFLDGDGSDPPGAMGLLVAPLAADTHDLVLGSRLRGEREPGSLVATQVVAGALASAALRLLYGLRVSDMGPFRAIRTEALRALAMREETYGWNLEMMMRAARGGLRILEVPVPHRRRAGGRSKVSGDLVASARAAARIAATLVRVAREPP